MIHQIEIAIVVSMNEVSSFDFKCLQSYDDAHFMQLVITPIKIDANKNEKDSRNQSITGRKSIILIY